MTGYKTTTCVICQKVHDTAANCPSAQAICSSCKELIEKEMEAEKSG